jgi:hypothetical protein
MLSSGNPSLVHGNRRAEDVFSTKAETSLHWQRYLKKTASIYQSFGQMKRKDSIK